MSPFRPDLVDVWVFRIRLGKIEILLMRRASGKILAGLWQGVSGSLEAGERIAEGALRELREETAFGPDEIEAFYDMDLVNQFHEPSMDAVVTAAVFAVRVGPDAEPHLSVEHDDSRWVSLGNAYVEVVWPGYRTALERIREDLSDPARAPWFELTFAGERARDVTAGAPGERAGAGAPRMRGPVEPGGAG